MTKINIPVARVRQGALLLYTTSMKVRDLISDNFYSVEKLDPEDVRGRGYQRLLNKARAKKLADYIIKGQDTRDAFLPTSVFLATDKTLPFDEVSNTVEIDTALVGPFSVVDGQHRLEGLKMAAATDERVLGFDVPVNIAVELPHLHQMAHFLIVNTTQKSVEKAVAQRIIARLTEAWQVEDLPELPKWIERIVDKGDMNRAVKLVDFLNTEEDSPWRGRIAMANSAKNGTTINQGSFVKAIEKHVLTANNPLLDLFQEPEKENKLFLNYWKAIASHLDDGDDENPSVLYKYIGVELFCSFSIPFFYKLQSVGSYKVETMKNLLSVCFENLEGDYAGLAHPDWWISGSAGGASFLNSGAVNRIVKDMAIALNKSSGDVHIEL